MYFFCENKVKEAVENCLNIYNITAMLKKTKFRHYKIKSRNISGLTHYYYYYKLLLYYYKY